jgi:hypothetical protein
VLPADAKSTFALVDVSVSATAAMAALASAFVARQVQIRGAAAVVENVTVQLSTSAVELGVVKLPALLLEPAVKLPVPTKVC